MTPNRNRHRAVDPVLSDELPELPPLDDDEGDGQERPDSLTDVDIEEGLDDGSLSSEDGEEDQGADDSSAGPWVDELVAETSETLRDADECGIDTGPDLPASALDGVERGLLEDSDEVGAADLTASEAGIIDDDSHVDADDRGEEGVMDPSFGLPTDELSDERSSPAEDETTEEDSLLELPLSLNPSLEAWPPKASLGWELCLGRAAPFGADRALPQRTDDLRVEIGAGRLVIVRRGLREVVPSLSGVTCAGIWESSPSAVHVLAALHEPARDVSALVLVRVSDDAAPYASVVLELDAQDLARADPTLEGEPDLARIEQLSSRATDDERTIIVAGAFGIRQVRPHLPLH